MLYDFILCELSVLPTHSLKERRLNIALLVQVYSNRYFVFFLRHVSKKEKKSKAKKVKFSLAQAMKAQRWSRGIALLFL